MRRSELDQEGNAIELRHQFDDGRSVIRRQAELRPEGLDPLEEERYGRCVHWRDRIRARQGEWSNQEELLPGEA